MTIAPFPGNCFTRLTSVILCEIICGGMSIDPVQPIDNSNFEQVYGQSPLGEWIYSVEDLPQLPLAKNVVIERDFIEIDGWLFPYSCVCESWLEWFQETMIRWVKSDDNKETEEFVNNMFQAFQDGIGGKI